jgi:hypothetical protein
MLRSDAKTQVHRSLSCARRNRLLRPEALPCKGAIRQKQVDPLQQEARERIQWLPRLDSVEEQRNGRSVQAKQRQQLEQPEMPNHDEARRPLSSKSERNCGSLACDDVRRA